MSRIVWGLTIAAVLNYAVLMWYMIFELSPATGGLKPFDLRIFGYSHEDAMAYLAVLRFDTAALLTGPIRIIDTSFPILFGAAGAGWIWMLSASRGTIVRLLAVALPIAYTVFDLIENALVGRILLGAMPSVELVSMASTITMTKFACVGLSFAALYFVLDSGDDA